MWIVSTVGQYLLYLVVGAAVIAVVAAAVVNTFGCIWIQVGPDHWPGERPAASRPAGPSEMDKLNAATAEKLFGGVR